MHYNCHMKEYNMFSKRINELFVLSLLLGLQGTPLCFAESAHGKSKQSKHLRAKKENFLIDQCRVDKAGGTLTLRCSGEYRLKEDVVGSITIIQPGISVDLAGHTIDAQGRDYAILIQGSPKSNGIGKKRSMPPVYKALPRAEKAKRYPRLPEKIKISSMIPERSLEKDTQFAEVIIPSNVHNIAIFKGTVQNAALAGIKVDTADSISLHDLDVYQNSVTGIEVSTCYALTIDSVNFALGDSALYLLNVMEATISALNIHNHTSTIDAIILAQSSDSLVFDGIKITDNIKNLPTEQTRGVEIGLFTASVCTNIEIINSVLNFNIYNNESTKNTFTYGLLLDHCKNGKVNNVTHNNNTITVSPVILADGVFNGFLCFGGEHTFSVIVTDCEANFNAISTPLLESDGCAFGGYANHHFSTEWIFERCLCNNNSISFGAFLGILTGDTGGSNVVIKDLQVFNNTIGDYFSTRGVSIEFDSNTLGTTIDGLQFNGNVIGNAIDIFTEIGASSDVNGLVTFSGTNDVTCKNIQCNNNQLGDIQTFNGISIVSDDSSVDTLQFNNNSITSLIFPLPFDANVSGLIIAGGNNVSCKNLIAQGNSVANGGQTRPDDSVRGLLNGVWIENYPDFGILSQNVSVNSIQFVGNTMGTTSPFTYVAGIFMDNGVNVSVKDGYIAQNSGGQIASGIYNSTYFDSTGSLNVVIEDSTVFDIGQKPSLAVVTTPAILAPIPATFTINSPRDTLPISLKTAEVTNPTNACSAITPIAGEIALVLRDGACDSATFVDNTQVGQAVATIIVTCCGAPVNGYAGTTTQTAVVISEEDGNALVAALASKPGTKVSIEFLFPETGAGIIYKDVANSKIIRSEAFGNRTSGIQLSGTSTGLSVIECVTTGNNKGIEFTADSSASCCLVQDCRAINNVQAGFECLLTPFDVTFVGNEAQCNTPNFAVPAAVNISLQTFDNSTGVFENVGTSNAALGSRFTNIDVVN